MMIALFFTNNFYSSFIKIAYIPADILKCEEVSRELTFYSAEVIENFRLEQKVMYEGMQMEGKQYIKLNSR